MVTIRAIKLLDLIMFEIITATKLKNSLLEFLKKIEKGEEYLVIRRGKPSAVLLPIDDYEKMMETIRFIQNKKFLEKLLNE